MYSGWPLIWVTVAGLATTMTSGTPVSQWHAHHGTSEPMPFGSDQGQCLCPDKVTISPCKCSCPQGSPQLECGSDLTSCAQLTTILNSCTAPVTYYNKLSVQNTNLSCSIVRDLFGGVATFRVVSLRQNLFTFVDNTAFSHFNDTIRVLNLEKNKLHDFFFPLLNELPKLEVLLLQHNELSFIPGSGAISSPSLRVFRAAHNHIAFLTSEVFVGLPRLERLDLSYNQIEVVPSLAFSIPNHQGNGLEIDLSYNRIITVEPGAFSGLSSCQLTLKHNLLQTLPEHSFRPLIDLTGASTSIYVTENPFTCDSAMCWIVTNYTVARCFDNYRCPNLNSAISTIIEGDLSNCQATTLPGVGGAA